MHPITHAVGEKLDLPRLDGLYYTDAGHGRPNAALVPQKDGSVRPSWELEYARHLARRPSVRALPPEVWINDLHCWPARPGGARAWVGDRQPFVANRLRQPPQAQYNSNETGRLHRGADGLIYTCLSADGRKRFYGIATDLRGGTAPVRVRVFRPEPGPGELDRRAVIAGLKGRPIRASKTARDSRLLLRRQVQRRGGEPFGCNLDPAILYKHAFNNEAVASIIQRGRLDR